MRHRSTRRFDRDLSQLPTQIEECFWKQLELLLENPRHPSLHTKRVRGKRGVWEARVDLSHRFTFHYEGDTVVLRAIGGHDEVFVHP